LKSYFIVIKGNWCLGIPAALGATVKHVTTPAAAAAKTGVWG